MKKFKLIKEYPGSPKLNDIIDLDNICWLGQIWLDNIKNYPEFWEEVVEKDYEILSFRNVGFENNGSFDDEAILKDDGLYHLISSNYKIHIKETLNSMILQNNFKIHSVKRLSDGEIFTIGDKVFSEYVNYTINKIGIVNDKCMVSALYDINNPNGSRLHYNLNNLKKFKQPLFTTEDGVDIFEGNTYYKVVNETFQLLIMENASKGESLKSKIFSTKEKAEEYVLYNKPLLTLKDVEELLCKNTSSYFLEKFKKRAQKLNK